MCHLRVCCSPGSMAITRWLHSGLLGTYLVQYHLFTSIHSFRYGSHVLSGVVATDDWRGGAAGGRHRQGVVDAVPCHKLVLVQS